MASHFWFAMKIMFYVLVAVLSGAMLALSQPFAMPLNPSIIVDFSNQGLLALGAMVPFLMVFKKLTPKFQFLVGYLLFFIANLLILSWIYVALHDIGGLPSFKSVGFWILAVFLLSIPSGFAFPLSTWIEQRSSVPGWLAFPVALTATEWLRGHFPWQGFTPGSIGHSLASVPLVAQSASVVGMYGLVFFAALVNSSFAELLSYRRPRQAWSAMTLLSLVAFLVCLHGSLALRKEFTGKETISVGILQPNISLEEKRDETRNKESLVQVMRNLQQEALRFDVDLVVWPETSLPYLLERKTRAVSKFGEFGATSIVGLMTFAGRDRTYDTAFAVSRDGKVLDTYDKARLIPIAEYLPWLTSVLVHGPLARRTGTYPGEQIRPLEVKLDDGRSLLVGAFICYDGLYPAVTRELTLKGAQLLVQLSSESWYIASAAPHQFLNMYRLRAIETGRPVVRAANNGVSGWIDASGKMHEASKFGERTVVVARVPTATSMTPYVLYGDFIPMACILIVLSVLARSVFRVARVAVPSH